MQVVCHLLAQKKNGNTGQSSNFGKFCFVHYKNALGIEHKSIFQLLVK